nr:FAD-binding protein [Pseudomonas anuradhapurensis]
MGYGPSLRSRQNAHGQQRPAGAGAEACRIPAQPQAQAPALELDDQIPSNPNTPTKLVPGSLGTFAGLRTDASARALDHAAQPVLGLYAVGNDMGSVTGGYYPSGGITLGPGMTFGYLAGRALSGLQAQDERVGS